MSASASGSHLPSRPRIAYILRTKRAMFSAFVDFEMPKSYSTAQDRRNVMVLTSIFSEVTTFVDSRWAYADLATWKAEQMLHWSYVISHSVPCIRRTQNINLRVTHKRPRRMCSHFTATYLPIHGNFFDKLDDRQRVYSSAPDQRK